MVSEKIFRNRPVRNKDCLWWPCLLANRDEMRNIYIEDLPWKLSTKFQFIWPSGFKEHFLEINQSETITKVWFIWPSSFREDFFFRNQPIRTKNGLWRPGLLTDQDEMSNFYRGPSIDASYQVFVYLPKWFQRRLTNQKQELPLVALFVNGSGRN